MKINGKDIDCKDLLRKFYFGNDKAAIEQYYKTASFLELFGIERWETSHTRFLTWLFNNSESVVRKFLYLVLKWSEIQDRPLAYINSNNTIDLLNSLYKDSVVFESIKAKTGGQSVSDDYGKGNTDIVIDCSITIDDEKPNKNMHIVIENKIYSPETTKSENGVTKYQTEGYYEYYNNFKDVINVFVFLKPVTTYELSQASNDTLKNWCHSDHFVIINYQELVDFVLTPYVNSDNIDPRVKYIVKEYIKSLGKTTENSKYSNKQIMAMAKDEKDLLVSFYLNNRDLIYAALSAVVDSDSPAISEDERKNAEDWKKQEESDRRSGKRTKFRVTIGSDRFENLYANQVVSKFAEYLLLQDQKIAKLKTKEDKKNKINNIIKEYSGNGDYAYFSNNIEDFNEYKKKKRRRCCKAFIHEKTKYYVTDQWEPNKENRQWNKFMNKVNSNKDYNFRIEKE